jgi:hypothetical protein
MLYRFVEMLLGRNASRMSERRNGVENAWKSRGRRASQTALTIVTGEPAKLVADLHGLLLYKREPMRVYLGCAVRAARDGSGAR